MVLATDTHKFAAFVAGPILAMEENSRRFEAFCCDLIGALEGGIVVFPTSKSWDLGKDGRALLRNVEVCVACGLEASVDSKALADIDRMGRYLPENAKVYFCTPHKLSDYAKQKLESELRGKLNPNVGIMVLSKAQLLAGVEREPAVLLKHYPAEYEDGIRTLSGTAEGPAVANHALRLSLSIASSQDSDDIRRQLYETLLLEALSPGPKTAAQLGNALSALIGLGRSFPLDVILTAVEAAYEKGFVSKVGDLIAIAEPGAIVLSQRKVGAVVSLIEGRLLFREAIESELGQAIVDPHFERIWAEVRSTLSNAFYERGSEMVEVFTNLLEKSKASAEPEGEQVAYGNDDALQPFIADLAVRVAATTSSEAQAEELSVAVRDIFTDPSTKIADWLSALCAKFVMLCSLGIEHQSGRAVAEALSRINIVLDTDVVLSLLCEGEVHHEAAKTIVSRWPYVGGRIFIADPVLREVAHHAWIAQFDHDQCKPWISGSREDRVKFIENAFVRAFSDLVAQKKAQPHEWPAYIRQFKGKDNLDFAKIKDVLLGDFKGVAVLPQARPEEQKLCEEVKRFLLGAVGPASSDRQDKIVRDKAERDAELYSAISSFLRMEREDHPDTNCILVSSAYYLSRVEERFGKLGESQIVLNTGSVVYLLSLVPGVSIGLSAMDSFLFDSRGVRFESELERRVIRAVASSSEYGPFGFARRTSLVRGVKNKLLEVAHRGGRPEDDALALVRKADHSGESAVRVSNAVKEALDALAVDTRAEVELRELRRKLAESEAKVDSLLEERRSLASAKKPYHPPKPRTK
jgi:hypothetical protein